MELLRRVLLVVSLLLAIWWALTPEPGLVAITTVDFAQEQQNRPGYEEAGRLTLDEFIAQRTQDRVLVVQGETWKTLVEVMRRGAAAKGLPAPWSQRLGEDESRMSLYFRVDEVPVNEVIGTMAAMGNFSYLRVGVPGQSEYLALRVGFSARCQTNRAIVDALSHAALCVVAAACRIDAVLLPSACQNRTPSATVLPLECRTAAEPGRGSAPCPLFCPATGDHPGHFVYRPDLRGRLACARSRLLGA